MCGPSPTERFLELAAKVDQFFSQTSARVGDQMVCASGCADCCQGHLTVTSMEAAVILDGLATMPGPARAQLAARGAKPSDTRCAALDQQDRCGIYAWRPLVCRSHGVPVRVTAETPGALPMVQVCPKNFSAGLESVASESILDQTTLSTVLGAIDAAYADRAKIPRGRRRSIANLLRVDPKETQDEH